MKLNGGKAEAFLKSPRDSVRAILFFGPDSGLIRERGKALVSHFADADDPFAVTEVSGDVLKKDGALLSDASNAMSLMGSASVVRVRDLTDAAAPIVESWLDSGAGALPAIFEASELTPRSKIRVLFETRDDAAAIGCYPDEGRDLGAVVREHFSSQGIKLAPDALPALLARLGTDRLAIRQELDKLILYAGGPDSGATLTVGDVEAAIGDALELILGNRPSSVSLQRSGKQNVVGNVLCLSYKLLDIGCVHHARSVSVTPAVAMGRRSRLMSTAVTSTTA